MGVLGQELCQRWPLRGWGSTGTGERPVTCLGYKCKEVCISEEPEGGRAGEWSDGCALVQGAGWRAEPKTNAGAMWMERRGQLGRMRPLVI